MEFQLVPFYPKRLPWQSREDSLKNPDMEILKEYFLCDTLLRKQGKRYFCRIIEEIDYKEITN